MLKAQAMEVNGGGETINEADKMAAIAFIAKTIVGPIWGR